MRAVGAHRPRIAAHEDASEIVSRPQFLQRIGVGELEHLHLDTGPRRHPLEQPPPRRRERRRPGVHARGGDRNHLDGLTLHEIGRPRYRFLYAFAVQLPLEPPIRPMLAKLVERLPEAGGWLYEPKMGRFRVLLFRDDREWLLQSRDLKPPESLLSRARIHDLGATTFTSGGRRRGC